VISDNQNHKAMILKKPKHDKISITTGGKSWKQKTSSALSAALPIDLMPVFALSAETQFKTNLSTKLLPPVFNQLRQSHRQSLLTSLRVPLLRKAISSHSLVQIAAES
jgi:hypothetical protein